MTEQELQALADRLDADLMTGEEFDALDFEVKMRMLAKRRCNPVEEAEAMEWARGEAKRLGFH